MKTARLLALALLGAVAAAALHPNMRRVAFLFSALTARAFPFLRPLLPALNGDGREEAAAAWVVSHSPPGNVTAAMAAFEDFATRQKWMMAVGPKKGALIAAALRDAAGHAENGLKTGLKVLELGTYCGYGSLLLAHAAGPAARVYTVEVVPRFATAAKAILGHAGLLDGRVTVLEGPLAQHAAALASLPPAGAPLSLAFVDHDKDAYLPDVLRLLSTPGLVKDGATVLGIDNLRVPGAPAMVQRLKSRAPGALETAWHETELEFVRGIPDLVAVSRVLDAGLALKE